MAASISGRFGYNQDMGDNFVDGALKLGEKMIREQAIEDER